MAAEALAIPLRDNPYVVQLLREMETAKIEIPAFTEMLKYVTTVENQLKSVTGDLGKIQQTLNEIQERQKHPISSFFQRMVDNMKTLIADVRANLGELKQSIIEGAKQALAALKEKGLSALNGIMRFFKVKDNLNAMTKSYDAAIAASDKTIARIDAMAAEVHEVTAHTRNIGRAARGKELVTKRENGKIAKAIQAPSRALRSKNVGLRRMTVSLAAKLENLENTVAKNKEKAAAKPSLLQDLSAKQAQVAATKPAPAAGKRLKPQEAAI
jgi:ABC-type transporter Mla subunit MlaD